MGLIEKRLIKLGLEEWLPESIKDLREVTGGQQFYEMERIGRANAFRGQASAMRPDATRGKSTSTPIYNRERFSGFHHIIAMIVPTGGAGRTVLPIWPARLHGVAPES